MKRDQTIRVEGPDAFIPLTQGLEAVIDAADVDLVKPYRWFAGKIGNVVYAFTRFTKSSKERPTALHRLLCNPPEELSIDHIDLDGLNNRRSNLRLATTSENSRNTRTRQNNTSGFKGVSWRRDRSRWQVHIRVDGKRLSLGHYVTLEDAASAYAGAAEKYHGEFARDYPGGIREFPHKPSNGVAE